MRVRSGGYRRSFGLRFRFLRLFKQVKGWRLFMIADAWVVFKSDSPAAEPMSAKRDAAGESQDQSRDERQRKRQADRSDVRQEFARFTKLDPASSLGKRTGASPSCRECLTTPAF
jgi:hypothetical protein